MRPGRDAGGRRARSLLRIAAIGAIGAIGVVAMPLVADWRQFLPRAVTNGATLELFGSSERDDLRNGNRKLVWNDDFLKEKLTLRSAGYMYHPRFLQYNIELAGALKQEQYDSTSQSFVVPAEWQSASGLEYKAHLYLLPEHPYNLELFALRWEPLFKERSAIAHDSVSESHGADFRYRKKPWFFHSRYSDNSLDTSGSSSDVDRLDVDGEYFRHYANGNQLSFRATAAPSRYSDSNGLDGRSNEASLTNDLTLGAVSLSSNLARTWIDQDDAARAHFESDQLAWYESLAARLPLGFRVDSFYRQTDNDSTYVDRAGARVDRLSNLDRDLEVNLIHQLYQSLQSIYTHRQARRESGAGESSSNGNRLSFNYNKSIPRGRILLGLAGSEDSFDNNGRAEISNEPHAAVAVPGRFTITQRNVDLASLAVYLRSPIAPFEVVRLTEQQHYVVSQVNDIVDVTVFALPPQFVVPGSYDLFVSYVLFGGSYRLDTTNFAHNGSLELLDRLITPYYSYSRVDSDVRSGTFPGTALDSTTTTGGVRFERGPVRARVEYQEVDWDVSPNNAWLGELQYIATPTPTTNVYGIASYWKREYPRGLSPLSGGATTPVTEAIRSLSGTFQKQLMDRRMTLALGGSLSSSDGVVDTSSYSLDSSLVWRVGRLDLSAGATYYHSDSDGVGVPDNRRSHHYYYLRLRRELF